MIIAIFFHVSRLQIAWSFPLPFGVSGLFSFCCFTYVSLISHLNTHLQVSNIMGCLSVHPIFALYFVHDKTFSSAKMQLNGKYHNFWYI